MAEVPEDKNGSGIFIELKGEVVLHTREVLWTGTYKKVGETTFVHTVYLHLGRLYVSLMIWRDTLVRNEGLGPKQCVYKYILLSASITLFCKHNGLKIVVEEEM
jgi:hypothetical protein